MYTIKQTGEELTVLVGNKQVLRYKMLRGAWRLSWKLKAFYSACYHDVYAIEDDIEEKTGVRVSF